MDDIDRQIIATLGENARTPLATLARRLGIARSTAQARLERLEERGTITGYTIRLGSETRRAQVEATVLLALDPRATPRVLARLGALSEVVRAHTASGRFDLVLLMRAETTAALDALLDRIGDIDGVRSSESLIHLSTRIDRAA